MLTHMLVSLVALAAQDAPTVAPPSATPPPAVASTAPAQPATAAQAAQPKAKAEKRRCETRQPIGSRLPSRVCMTDEERRIHEEESRELLRRIGRLPDNQGG